MRFSTCLLWSIAALLEIGVIVLLLDVVTGWRWTILHVAAPGCMVLATACVPASICARILERRTLRSFMLSGIIASFLAAAAWIYVISIVIRGEDPETLARAIRIAWTPLIWAGAMMWAGSIGLVRVRDLRMRIARWVLIALVCGLAAHALIWMWVHPMIEARSGWWAASRFNEAAGRIFGVLATLAACGALVFYLLAKARQFSGDQVVPDEDRQSFQIICPRCGSEQMLRTAGDACRTCGLRVKVTPA